MQLVAIYKTFDGGEFVDASLASIYDDVDDIVMVHSDTSWLGETGNTVREDAMRWCAEHDHDEKVHHLDVSCRTQEEQYRLGIDFIRTSGIPFDAVLAIDADEVWEPGSLPRAKEQFAASSLPAARCNMHTYLKTPFYRVNPPWGSPTVLFKDPELLTKSPRGCQAPAVQLNNVWMHHYTYVRRSRDLVWQKIQQSCQADGGEHIVENWMCDIYDRLPDGMNLHAFVRWREVWRSVRRIEWSDVPPAVRGCDFIREFWPPGLLMDGERNALFRLAHGRLQAIDLGTYKGLSAVILGVACEHCHTVDAYDAVPEQAVANRDDPAQYQKMKGDHNLEDNRRLFERFGNITSQASETSEAGWLWSGPPVDVLFVDADHSAEGTLSNVRSWWSHLKNGGRIILHDNNELHPGVMEAVKTLRKCPCLEECHLPQWSGSLAAFDKIGDVMP